MGLVSKAGYLGEHLIKNGVVTEQQIQDALYVQSHNKKRGIKKLLGQILIELGYCTEKDIAQAVANKTGYEYFSINNIEIDLSCMSLISPEIAAKYKLIPVSMEDDKLLVAMQNPNDIIAIDDIQILTGLEVKPIVVPDGELLSVIERYTDMFHNQKLLSDDDNKEAEFGVIKSDIVNETPAVVLINQILEQAVRAQASDIHIEPMEKTTRIRFRIDGVMHEIMQQPLSMHPVLASRIKVMAEMDIAERRIPQDGRISLTIADNAIDIRVASLPSIYGEKITLRLLNRSGKIMTLKELGFTDAYLEYYNRTIQLPYGFILITGPTGSGKSTTLYSSLGIINTLDKNIITLEDPVEIRVAGLNQIQMNRKAGMTFSSGLRSILRNDPDVIMVGEIRDQETAKIAVESALTGHLVFSTLHTNDSAGAVTRLGEMGVEPFLTASSLAGVIAQRLMRLLCLECRKSYTLSREEILSSVPDFPLDPDEEFVTLYKPQGCIACNKTGYKGRIGVFEFLRVSETMQRLILRKASTNEIRELAIAEGMHTLRQDGLLKVKQGLSCIEELLRVIM